MNNKVNKGGKEGDLLYQRFLPKMTSQLAR